MRLRKGPAAPTCARVAPIGRVALGGALVAALALAAGAQAGGTKHKPVATKAVCKISQSVAYDHCTANPLFASRKTECATATSLLQAAAPSLTLPAGYQTVAAPDTLSCYWKVNGMSQAAAISVSGWKGGLIPYLEHEGNPHPDSSIKNVTVAQQFEADFAAKLAEWDPNYSFCPYPSMAAAQQPGGLPQAAKPQKTTLDGHEAWINDPCPTAPDSTSPEYAHYVKAGTLRELHVLDGTVAYTVWIRNDVGKVVDANGLMTIARGLIAKYQKFAP